MNLLENNFEQKLLLELPPHARDVAHDLLTTESLGGLLSLREKNEPDKARLKSKNVPENLWLSILNAAILAKSTYFLPNPKFSQEEILFLIKAACSSINYPIKQATLMDLIEYTRQQDMETLYQWLKDFSKLLIKQNQEKSLKF